MATPAKTVMSCWQVPLTSKTSATWISKLQAYKGCQTQISWSVSQWENLVVVRSVCWLIDIPSKTGGRSEATRRWGQSLRSVQIMFPQAQESIFRLGCSCTDDSNTNHPRKSCEKFRRYG